MMLTNSKDSLMNEELKRLKARLQGYEELLIDQVDDEAYVARGNGFCDSKYSPEFLEEQIEILKKKINEIEGRNQ